MKTRMWVVETDQYGATDRKFNVDEPSYIPRVGEFIDCDAASGWVDHIQWNYPQPEPNPWMTVYVYLKREKNV